LLLVTLENVDVRLWGRTLLAGVSFALREGESWALLGENGAGKSSFLRLLRGDLWPHPESRGRRLYHFPDGPSESPIGARELMPLVSAESQDAYLRGEWNLRVEDVVRTGFAGSTWLDRPISEEEERRAGEAMALLGIEDLRRRSILEVSTGEARKVLLARALAPRPRALLLDEFCNGLDAPSRASVLGAVSAIARGGTPVVFATHRPEEIVPEVGHALLLERGRVVAQGPRREVLARFAASHPAPGAAPAAEDGSPAQGPVLVSVEHADVLVEGRRVLRDLTWRMREGENWAVRGPNGAGKSTFLRLLCGEEHAAPGGKVRRLDLGERASVWEVKARVGLVTPQLQSDHRADHLGEEVVLSGFFASIGLGDEPSAAQRKAARRWMERLGIGHLAGRRIHSLSYGELRKLLLARALVRDPEVLLLDEPFNGLDPRSRVEMMELVEGLCQGGTRVVLVTHHDGEVLPCVNRVLELRDGRIVYQGQRRTSDGGPRPGGR
jgi:molybdate transport system ATP-binding protein